MNIYKNWKARTLLGLDESEDINDFTNHDISERNIKCDICITELWNDMFKNDILKEVRALNKIDRKPRDCIFGVLNKIIRKIIDYFFVILGLGNASFRNGSLFNQIK